MTLPFKTLDSVIRRRSKEKLPIEHTSLPGSFQLIITIHSLDGSQAAVVARFTIDARFDSELFQMFSRAKVNIIAKSFALRSDFIDINLLQNLTRMRRRAVHVVSSEPIEMFQTWTPNTTLEIIKSRHQRAAAPKRCGLFVLISFILAHRSRFTTVSSTIERSRKLPVREILLSAVSAYGAAQLQYQRLYTFVHNSISQ